MKQQYKNDEIKISQQKREKMANDKQHRDQLKEKKAKQNELLSTIHLIVFCEELNKQLQVIQNKQHK